MEAGIGAFIWGKMAGGFFYTAGGAGGLRGAEMAIVFNLQIASSQGLGEGFRRTFTEITRICFSPTQQTPGR